MVPRFDGLELAVTIPYSFGIAQVVGLPLLIGSLFKAGIEALLSATARTSNKSYEYSESAKVSISYAGFFALTTCLPIIGAIIAYELALGPSAK